MAKGVEVKWESKKVAAKANRNIAKKMKLVGQVVRDKVVKNISRPVKKKKGERSGKTVVERGSRSKPGEFPKADTTRLMKSIFFNVTETRGSRAIISTIIATSLKYGAILETSKKLDRRFLMKTVEQEKKLIRNTTMRPPPIL